MARTIRERLEELSTEIEDETAILMAIEASHGCPEDWDQSTHNLRSLFEEENLLKGGAR